MGLEMNPTCFRCGRPGFATLKVAATIEAARLKISGEADPAGLYSSCTLGLA